MDSALRTAPGLLSRIDRLRDDLMKRFENIIKFAAIEKTDRNTTAVVQYQIQVETAALIRAAEELQGLIRNMQEMWLFGQLKTTGDTEVQHKTDEDARVVAGLLTQLLNRKADHDQPNGDAMNTSP